MQDLFLVDVVESFADLTDDRAGLRILEAMTFPHLLQKLSISTKLDKQIHVVLIFEVAV